MGVPDDLKFTEDHEWLRLEGPLATVGITAHACEQLGDVVFVELPEVGRTLARGEAFGVVESVKAASDLFAPVAGEVVAVNTALPDAPQTLNEDCYGAAWLMRLRPTDVGEVQGLLGAAAYEKLL